MAVLPDPGRSRAVLIGASTYSHLEDLPAVRNNLSGFRDVLVAPALGGLPADNCMVVAEPARPVDVYRALRQHAAAAEDTLLVYFAGHGRTGSRNELFLCLPGTDPDELAYSAWPYDELRRVVADSRATKKVVILDCCFSGRALADQAGDEETILGQVGIDGTYLLTATAANAVALAPPGEPYTAFTGTLLGLLSKGIPGGPELLTFAQIYPRLQYTLTSRQLPRPRQQGSDTIAHLALTRNLAYNARGETPDFNERFTAITAELSDAQPAVRLAGVHAMARLADDWEQNRQTCVDQLCRRLRLPYDPDPGEDAAPADRAAYRADREVRHTIIRVITTHLRGDAAVSWQGLNFDFKGVVFDGGDFSRARFSGGKVKFGGAKFTGGTVDFTDAEFSAGEVGFGGAMFFGSEVSFGGAEFSGGTVDFRDAMFFGGTVGFGGAEFSGGTVDFSDAELSTGGTVDFHGAKFSGGTVDFRDAKFFGGEVDFHEAKFSTGGTVNFSRARFGGGGTVDFRSARFSGGEVGFVHAEFFGGLVMFASASFSGGEVSFGGAEFSGGKVSFSSARFSGGTVDFSGAMFSGGEVDFWDAKFSRGTVGFSDAMFSGGEVGFVHAEFSGGEVDFGGVGFSGTMVNLRSAKFSGSTVDFSHASDWSCPPNFHSRWAGTPPPGVKLPKKDDQPQQ